MKLSASSLSTFKSCPHKYNLKYVQKIKPLLVEDSEALRLGSAFHRALETGDLSSEEYAYFDDKTIKMIVASSNFVKNHYTFKTEDSLNGLKICDLNDDNLLKEYHLNTKLGQFINLNGFIDLVLLDDVKGDIIIDYKFTSSSAFADSYKTSDQSVIYKTAYEQQTGRKVLNVYFLVVLKPTIRLKKSETPDEYFQRVQEWYTDDKILLQKVEKFEELQSDLEKDLTSTLHCVNNNLYFKNKSACHNYGRKCEYWALCHHEDNAELDYRKENN